MFRHKPDLIVPIRDRRQRRRILTLRRFGIAMAVLTLLFIGISIRSEMRGRTISDEYGRLFGREIPPSTEIARKPVETVTEGTVQDEISADPFLVEAAAREQILGTRELEPVPTATQSQVVVVQRSSVRDEKGGVTIVGGAEGVAIVKTTTNDLPRLRGGFGQ